jgi:hypothetical protein
MPCLSLCLQVPYGLSCRIHTAVPGDDWQKLADKYKVLINELIRSNPTINGSIQPNMKVYLPPCIDGKVQTKQA